MRNPAAGVCRALSLCLAIVTLATAPAWGQQSCFRADEPLLFDTSNNPNGVPWNSRVLGVKLLHHGNGTYLMYNTGNELALRNIDDPQNPGVPRNSNFNVPPFGDRDYNLFNFDVCDDCRFGVAGFDAQGTILFDLGATPAGPLFAGFRYYPESSGIGGLTFKQGTQEYLIAKNLPGGCIGNPTLWQIDGVRSSDLLRLDCVDAGGQAMGTDGGYRVSDPTGDYLVIADQSRKGYIFRVDPGPSLVYTDRWVYAPTTTGHGFAVDVEAGLAVSAFGDVRLYDISAGLDSLELIAQWSPETAHTASIVALSFPFLWVSVTAGQCYAYNISDPYLPRRIDTDFWDNSKGWNAYPFGQNRDAIFTDDGSWMFVARFSVLQRFESGSALPYNISPLCQPEPDEQ